MKDEADFLCWLTEKCGYLTPTRLPGNRYACLNVRMYNVQLIVGRMGNQTGYEDAW